ncbi:MAG: pre-peptidase C-terminal domain-containing protein [Anaerolineae bacterium]
MRGLRRTLLLLFFALAVLVPLSLLLAQEALSETYTSQDGTLTFSYPADWVILEQDGQVIGANSESVAETAQASDFEPAADEVAFVFIVVPAEEAGSDGVANDASAAEFLSGVAGELTIEETTVDGVDVAYASFDSQGDGPTFVAGRSLSNGTFLALIALTPYESITTFQPTLLAILASASYTPPPGIQVDIPASDLPAATTGSEGVVWDLNYETTAFFFEEMTVGADDMVYLTVPVDNYVDIPEELDGGSGFFGIQALNADGVVQGTFYNQALDLEAGSNLAAAGDGSFWYVDVGFEGSTLVHLGTDGSILAHTRFVEGYVGEARIFLVVDGDNNVYVDLDQQISVYSPTLELVRVFDTAGKLVAISPDNVLYFYNEGALVTTDLEGNALDLRLTLPDTITYVPVVAAGNDFVYVAANYGTGLIYQFDATGTLTAGYSLADFEEFTGVQSMALLSNGDLLLADGSRLLRLQPSVFSAAALAAVPTETPPDTNATTGEPTLRVSPTVGTYAYSEPSEDAADSTIISLGEFAITGVSADGEWYRVEYEGADWWIHDHSGITVEGDLTSVEVIEVTSTAEEPEPGGGEIAYGDTVDGTLAAGVTDSWTFEGHEGDLVSIEVESDDFDTVVELVDSDNNIITSDDNSGSGSDSQIEDFELPADGSYTLQVYSAEEDESGAYAVSLEAQEARVAEGDNADIDLEYGDEVEDRLRSNRTDEWTFFGETGDIVTIALHSEDFDTYLILYDADGNEIARNDDYNGLNSQINEIMLPDDGIYTIEARGYSSSASGDYTLTLELVDQFTDEDRAARALEYGQESELRLRTGSTDTLTFEGSEGDVITIEVESDDFSPYIELYTANGTYLTYADFSNNDLSRITQYVLPDDATYSVRVYSYSSSGGDYTASIELVDQVTAEDLAAQNLEYGETGEGHLRNGAATQDWTFEGSSDDIVTISVESDDFSPYIELYDANGYYVTYNNYSDNDEARIVEYQLVGSGTYTIRVYSYSTLGAYTVSVELVDQLTDEERAERTMEYGETIEGRLVSGRRDQWTFEGSEGDVVTIALNSEDFDTYLMLLDPQGATIVYNDDFNGLNSQINEFELDADGTYTIVARGYSTSASGDYTLSLDAEGVERADNEDDQQPNAADGTALEYGDSVDGQLDQNQQSWTFEGEEGDVITISLESDDFNTYVEIYTEDGELLESDNNGGDGSNSLISELELPQDTTYTIVVSSFRNEGSGAYTLTLEQDG